MDGDAYELVRRMWTDFREGGVEGALPLLAEDVEFVSADGEVYAGHEGVREFFAAFAAEGRRFEASPYSFERVGAAVLAAGHRRIRGPAGTEGAFLYFVHVVAGGRIVRLSAHPTRADALAAVRGTDGAAPAPG